MASISGVVYEAGTATPLAAVDILVSPGQIRTKTDAHGHYILRALESGRYTIQAYADEGRGEQASKVITLNGGQDLGTADFYLTGQAQYFRESVG